MTASGIAPAGLSPITASILIVFALLSSTMTVAALLHWSKYLPQANPTNRSMHQLPVPRVGGVAIWVGALPALLLPVWLALPGGKALAIAWSLVAAVSLIDDIRGLSFAIRLVVHCVSATLIAVALAGAGSPLSPLAFGAVVLLLAWSANLYNFMDGSDGLAALMALIGFSAFAMVAPPAEALLCAAVAAATLAPLRANFPSARLFLGDVGAVPLGFLAGAIGIRGVFSGHWGAWFPVLVFLPFVADATVTLSLRILRRERIWEAHRSHFYQRLLKAGAGHRGTLAVYGAWMAGTASTAVVLWRWQPAYGNTALGAWCIVTAILLCGIDYHCRRMARISP